MSSKVKTILGMTPTITLRKINHQQIVDKLRAGGFSTISRNSLNLIEHQPVKIAPKIISTATSPHDQTYVYRDPNSNLQTATTTNSTFYTGFLQDGSELPTMFQCFTCRQHRNYLDGRRAVGFPIKMEFINGELYVWMTTIHCNYRCAYSEVKRRTGGYARFQNPIYQSSEQILRHLHQLEFPGETLEEALDPELLQPYGPLTPEEFEDANHPYSKTNNLVYAPVKRTFIKT